MAINILMKRSHLNSQCLCVQGNQDELKSWDEIDIWGRLNIMRDHMAKDYLLTNFGKGISGPTILPLEGW